jgi:4,5-DOPA dioxygenase extradiol
MKIGEFKNITGSFSKAEKQPVLFIGHGNPMNVITENPYRKSWEELGSQLPKPNAILCVSAHWYTNGTFVTMNEFPPTIHDFSGFAPELYAQQYPAPGAVELAAQVMENVAGASIRGASDWGLDHGAWCVLKPMFPAADIPVFQLSIDYTRPPEFHYELGAQLAFLREKGVLIIGSGNIVHNLRMARWDDPRPYDWAVEFDHIAREKLVQRDDISLVEYEKFGGAARFAIPTNEHYLPLLYVLGASEKGSKAEIFNDSFDLASISMMSVILH